MPDYIDITIDESPIYIEIASSSAVYVDISLNEPTVTGTDVSIDDTGYEVLTGATTVQLLADKTEEALLTSLTMVLVLATGATIDVDADNYDEVDVTALASGTTFSNPTGTPTDGQKLLYRYKDNGTSRSLALGTDFVDLVGIPTSTTISKVGMFGARWSAARSKWEIIATVTEP